MKTKILLVAIFLFSLASRAQDFHLKIIGSTTAETKIIDSIDYISKHQNTKFIIEEINQLSEKLTANGFIEKQILETIKTNDSSYLTKITLGNKTKNIHIYIGVKNNINSLNLFNEKKDTLILPYTQVEPFLKQTLQKLEQNGYAFAKLKLINIQTKKQTLYADLELTIGNKRQLNEIVLKYINEQQKNIFPKGALKQINKKYAKKKFNQETVNEIYNEFEKFSFVNQVKFPEVLFTKDTTKVYVYLAKRKTNTFDGYLGFNNTENKKTTLNGFLDITLQNALRSGEQLSIYWKNDGNDQKVFNAKIDLPYLFNKPIGFKALINIFKQDSTYQNTKTEINLGYLITINKRFYIGYQSTESSNIQNSINSQLSDYTNSFLTTNFEFTKSDYTNQIAPIKSYITLNFGTGKRTTTEIATSKTEKQYLANFNIMNNFYFDKKNCINIKSQNYFLKSNTYLTNELFRFGGINSIRGFSENSLQANFMTSVITEYRYLISPNLQLNSILDYCYYKDPTTIEEKNKTNKLVSIGLGITVATNNGILKLAITNGNPAKQEMKFYNTFACISYNVKF
ncbi:BamA/TamA family outer membrane protein [Flavobacterium laiguense]|uniref:POTRA domain-containing protein n=1 Tax=Flavobacterium laiguense TaxID=2169409 RepID=A0A2U1JYG3_9FLAO|nr:hypothetical protein [Flavobacterium laiguense]PWA09838.1 hypothetical protein DB891_06595 [Flavobacterium laiguense]